MAELFRHPTHSREPSAAVVPADIDVVAVLLDGKGHGKSSERPWLPDDRPVVRDIPIRLYDGRTVLERGLLVGELVDGEIMK